MNRTLAIVLAGLVSGAVGADGTDSNLLYGVAGALAPGGRIAFHADHAEIVSADGLTTWRLARTSYGYDAWSGARRTEIRTAGPRARISLPGDKTPRLELTSTPRGHVVRTVLPSRLYREVRRSNGGYTTLDR